MHTAIETSMKSGIKYI